MIDIGCKNTIGLTFDERYDVKIAKILDRYPETLILNVSRYSNSGNWVRMRIQTATSSDWMKILNELNRLKTTIKVWI